MLSEAELKELVLPKQGELLGRVIKMPGGDHVIVKCTDGKVRMCRIRGKMKRKMWVRDNDVVLVTPWDFQDGKADIVWRYIGAHVDWLIANNYIGKE